MSIKNAPVLDLTGCAVRVPVHVVYRSFVAETVMLNLETGLYHGLSPVGGRMLERLERSRSFDEAVVAIADEYDQPEDEVRADMREFCLELADRGLVTISGPTPA